MQIEGKAHVRSFALRSLSASLLRGFRNEPS